MRLIRDIVYQPFDTFSLVVGTTPTRISPTFTKADLIDSFVVSVPASAANNVFIGNASVTTTSGLEIVAGGGPILFRIRNQIIQYDIHSSLDPAANAITQCQELPIQSIPFIIWDLTQIYLIATAPTTISVAPFKSMFI